MEKMPFRDENPELNATAAIEAASGAGVTTSDWRSGLPVLKSSNSGCCALSASAPVSACVQSLCSLP